MSSIFHRYLIISLLAISTTIVYAETPSKPDPNEPSVFLKSLNSSTDSSKPTPINTPVLKNEASSTQLQELQNTQLHLQDALIVLERESNQLQSNLSVLTEKLSKISPLPQQTPEQTEKIEQLRAEHQQIQNALMELRQQEVTLQTRISALSQQLIQLREAAKPASSAIVVPNKISAAPVEISPITPSANVTTTPTQIAVTTTSSPALQTTVTVPTAPTKPTKALTTQQDPTTMLRIGVGFIVLALLLLGFLLWPRKKEKKTPFENTASKTHEEFAEEEENIDLEEEYDFMGEDEAIPTRLNLARGYIEMEKYSDARKALELVFEKGDELQIEEAKNLLRQIEEAENA